MIGCLKNALLRSRGGRELMDTRGWKRLKHGAKIIGEHDVKTYGGWKSAELVFSDAKQKPSLVGRLDWHIVQFILALLPACASTTINPIPDTTGVYALAQWAQYDMERNPHFKKMVVQQEQQQSLGPSVDMTNIIKEENIQLQQRLIALEETVRELQKKLVGNQNDSKKTGETPSPPPAPPPAKK